MRPPSELPRRSPFFSLVPVVGVLIAYIWFRWDRLLAMPPFIDEFLHIQWAQDVYTGHFLTGAANGRLMALWWMSLFQLTGDGALWITRGVTVLFAMIAVAVLYNLGRVFISRWAGLFAAGLYVLAPFTFFHDRLGLSDAYVSTFGILAVWFSVRYACQHRALDAILAGLAITASIVVKATGIMLVVVPGIVLVLLIPLGHWRHMLRGLVLAYGGLGVTALPFYLLLRWRGWAYFGVATSVVGTDKVGGWADRLVSNIVAAWQMDAGYLSAALLVAFVLSAVYLVARRGRVGLAVTLVTVIPLLAMLSFATKISGRYILIHVPALLLCVGMGIALLSADLARRGGLWQTVGRPLTVIAPFAWALLFALPLCLTMSRRPEAVPLPGSDWIEYVGGDSAGFGLDAAAHYLGNVAAVKKEPVHVIGLLANCGGMGLQIPAAGPVTLECPYINYDGKQQSALAELVNRRAREGGAAELWIAIENSPYISLDGIAAQYDKIATFDRPGGVVHVTLYTVRKAGA